MSSLALKTSNEKQGLIKLDSRTFLYLLVVGNLAVFMMPSVIGEILLMGMIILLALLCGARDFSLKLGIAYFVLLAIDYLTVVHLGDTWLLYIVLGFRFTRKVFPCAILGGTLIQSTRVSDFMASLNKMHTPKSVSIPLTVLLRYFPSIGEDRRAIKKAMAMRGLSGGVVGFFKHPSRTIECIYVPLLMSASRRADELSCAAVTRGIENPMPRTSLTDVRFGVADFICAVIATGYAALCVWGI